ncbi:hypothetical protein [Geodermatophilus sp. CPCC 205506]|uniref:hypothetical protein n=1 Tax=Geodermatophilus sp. CPCC 205506 TaxID=2936596 RepID=UPI003EEC658D
MPTFATPGPVAARIQAAEQTRVEYNGGTLLVSSPRRPRLLFFGGLPSVEVDVLLPERSVLAVDCGTGDVDCSGPLGAVRATVSRRPCGCAPAPASATSSSDGRDDHDPRHLRHRAASTACCRSAGARRSRWAGYLWARAAYDRRPAR